MQSRNPVRTLGLVALLAAFTGCGAIAVATAPAKTPARSASPLAADAKAAFWRALHGEHYAALPAVTEGLTRAWLEAPRDGELALLLAHAHFWAVVERDRSPEVAARITDRFVLARFYFEQAAQLRPDDHRIPGWLGGVEASLGRLHDDEGLKRRGYYTLRDGVARYPEFNHFSFGYALSQLPADHPRFPEALDAMWESIDVCAGERVDRDDPDYAAYASPWRTPPANDPMRVCWNGEIAPHNFEGFFLHNGDLLAKAGRPEAARAMYANARLAPGYARWPYREVLEQRIADADARSRAHARSASDAGPKVMVQTRYACSGCHARGGQARAAAR